jgi:hypothetical protein
MTLDDTDATLPAVLYACEPETHYPVTAVHSLGISPTDFSVCHRKKSTVKETYFFVLHFRPSVKATLRGKTVTGRQRKASGWVPADSVENTPHVTNRNVISLTDNFLPSVWSRRPILQRDPSGLVAFTSSGVDRRVVEYRSNWTALLSHKIPPFTVTAAITLILRASLSPMQKIRSPQANDCED